MKGEDRVELQAEEAGEQLRQRYAKAEEIIGDVDKAERFLQRLEQKLKEVPLVGERLALVPTLASLFRSYVKGEYRAVPSNSLVAIVAALIYFVSPLDVVPDWLPLVGYLDDATVLQFCCQWVEGDIKKYEQWRELTRRTV